MQCHIFQCTVMVKCLQQELELIFLKFILSFKKYVLLIIGYLGYFGFRTVQYRIQLDKTFKYKVNYV